MNVFFNQVISENRQRLRQTEDRVGNNLDLMLGDECVLRSEALLLHLIKVPLIFSPSFHEPLKVPSSWSPVGSVSVPW